MANASGIGSGEAVDHVTQVRQLLRHHEFRRAIEMIDRRLLGTPGSPAPASTVIVDDVRTYAYDRMTRHGPGPGWRNPVSLRRGAPLSLRRSIRVDLRRLGHAEVEPVLTWLLAEELRDARDATRLGDYPGVLDAAETAANIDDRSTRMAGMHARALYEIAVAAMNEESPDLDDVLGKLQRAARLAARVAQDPAGDERYRKLSAAIGRTATTAEQRRARAAQIEAVDSVIRRFDRLVRHYSSPDQVVSHVQLGIARASLAQIGADAERLSRQHPANTPAGRLLRDLRVKCLRYRDHLERLGRSVITD